MSRPISKRLWKLRQRFGIAAPQMQIQTHVPWYWRWVGITVLLGISVASAGWIYDAGGRFAGFERNESEQELLRLRAELQAADTEVERLRALANAADNRVAIERTAQQQLAQQIRLLEQENAKVREELASFESLLSPGAARTGNLLTIHRFRVEPDVLPGEYRYHLLLVGPSSRRERDFRGRLELVVNLQEAGRSVMISFPEKADDEAAAFRLAFKYFRRIEGTFRVNPAAKVQSVQVRVYETGAKEPRATEAVAL